MTAVRFVLRFEGVRGRLVFQPSTPAARAWLLARPEATCIVLAAWAKHRDACFVRDPSPPPAGMMSPTLFAVYVAARLRERYPEDPVEIVVQDDS